MVSPLIIGIMVASVLAILWFFSTYNRLISMSADVNKSWSDIDVSLQKRYDTLTSMANAAERFAVGVEKEFFREFAKASQSAAAASSSGNVGGVNSAESLIAGMIPKISMIAENHPELTGGGLYN